MPLTRDELRAFLKYYMKQFSMVDQKNKNIISLVLNRESELNRNNKSKI